MDKCKTLEFDKFKGLSEIYEEIWGSRESRSLSRNRKIEFLKVIYPKVTMMALMENHGGFCPPTGNYSESDLDLILQKLESYPFRLAENLDYVIDFGSGLGAYSTAAIELGIAKNILMLDGSKKALDTYEDRLIKTENLLLSPEKIISKVTKCHVNLNYLDSLIEFSGYNKADLVFSRYVLMHTANPFLSIYNMTRLCKLGGTIAFNIFLPQAVPPVVREERIFTKQILIEKKLEVLNSLGKLHDSDKKCTIEDFLSKKALPDSSFDKIRDFYNKYLIPKYGIDLVETKCFHAENSTTPYIHTPSKDCLEHFLYETMKLLPRDSPIKSSSEPGVPEAEYWGSFKVTEETLKTTEDQIPTIEIGAPF